MVLTSLRGYVRTNTIPRTRQVTRWSETRIIRSVFEKMRMGDEVPLSKPSRLDIPSQSAQTLCFVTNSPNSFIAGKSKYHESVFSNSFMSAFWSRSSPFASSSGIVGMAARFVQKFASDEYASSLIESLWGSLFSVDVISPPQSGY